MPHHPWSFIKGKTAPQLSNRGATSLAERQSRFQWRHPTTNSIYSFSRRYSRRPRPVKHTLSLPRRFRYSSKAGAVYINGPQSGWFPFHGTSSHPPLKAALPVHRPTMTMPLNHDDCEGYKHHACQLEVAALHPTMQKRWNIAAEIFREAHKKQVIKAGLYAFQAA